MDFTILRTTCRSHRLRGLVQSSAGRFPLVKNLSELLFPDESKQQEIERPSLTVSEESTFNAKGCPLPLELYNLTRECLLRRGIHSVSAQYATSVSDLVLPRYALQRDSATAISINEHIVRPEKSHLGNACIFIREMNGTRCPVFIQSIYEQAFGGKIRTYLEVVPLQMMALDDEARNPFKSYTGFGASLAYSVKDTDNASVILLEDVVSYGPSFTYPAGTFGIPLKTTCVIDMDRGKVRKG